MSICWVSSYSEAMKRAVSFVTINNPSMWINSVKKLAFVKGVDEIEVFRSSKNGIMCYDLTIFINYTADESEDDTLNKLFSPEFLQTNLPLSKDDLGVFQKVFARVGPSRPSSKIQNQPVAPDDLYVIYETIEYNNSINASGFAACYKSFMDLPNRSDAALFEPANNYKEFKNLADHYGLVGGSWLVMPKTEFDQTLHKCRRFFEDIIENFVNGPLNKDYITRVTYSSMKSLVKVSNKKTKYFEYLERNLVRDTKFDEEAFRDDDQVSKTYLALTKLKLYATLKYKPDVFTACKLNTKNTAARLTFYTALPHNRKVEIASELE